MDVMASIVSHLSGELGCMVSTERPANPPKRMVTVIRAGGGGSRFMDTARVVVHAWGASEKDAYTLGLEAAGAMFTLPGADDNVAEVTQDSFYQNIYTDGTRRWSGAYVIVTNR